MHNNIFKKNGIIIRFCEVNDAEFILSLRTNKTLNKYISDTDNDLDKQRRWLHSYKDREKQKQEFYYIIEDLNGEKWGTCRIYNLTDNYFTVGSWLCRMNAPGYIAIKADILMKDYGFATLKYNECRFDVRKNNKKVLKYTQLYEPILKDEDELNYYFSLTKDTYLKNREKICNLLDITL